ncbi:MAG: hypothetical protein IKJ67_11125 [Bacteroidales bacterium]|nr:hypothetical protein [Bacteroidales bacterium]
MEKDLKNIDKHIYTVSSDITKCYKHITWAFICTAIGAIALWLYMSYETIANHPAWSAIALGFIFIGVFSVGTILCYYTIGDCHAPYHKPTRQRLSREEMYFSSSNAENIKKHINEKDIKALDKYPKGIVPQVVVIKYSNDDDSIMAVQAFDNGKPITDIVVCS